MCRGRRKSGSVRERPAARRSAAGVADQANGCRSSAGDAHLTRAVRRDRDETTDSVTTDAYGSHSTQRSVRRLPILPPDVLRTLPFGTGVVMLRTARPIITNLRAWPRRRDADELHRDRAEIERLLRFGA